MGESKRVAILIDAENVYPTHAEQIFEKAESLGTIVHKEIYGAAAAINMWISPVLKYVIHTNLSIRTTKGKNTSDIALAIGAMDILMKGNIDYMIIVSSDSDFSTLAVRLRSSNVTVVGMGSDAVNPLWKVACSDFVTLEYTQEEKNEFVSGEDGQECDEDQPKEVSMLEAPVSSEERRALIFKVIQEQITNGGGKVSAPRLFLALNELPAYQVDKQTSGFKKAQQYLSAVFADKVYLEFVDGTAWVFLADSTQDDSMEAVNTAEDANPSQDSMLEAARNPILDVLQENGIGTDIAAEIVATVADSKNKFVAFNKLRTKFGNELGTKYYHQIKDMI